MSRELTVTVIGGYLGAGKTTLLNHLLTNTVERVAVLVNDFGSVNVDERLIRAEDDDKIALANGCICCSLVDGFAAALQTVLDLEDPPPRLVVEASGVADPAQVAAYGHGPGLRLDGVVVVVDVETIETRLADEYVGDTVAAQLRAADLIVLNKIDLVEPEALDRTRAAVVARAPDATPVEAEMGRVSLGVLLGPALDRDKAPPVDRPADGPADTLDSPGDDRAGHRSWSFRANAPIDRPALERWLADLPVGVVRAKGVVRFATSPDVEHLVQRVGTRSSVDLGPPVTVGGSSRPASESTMVAIALPGAAGIDEDLVGPPGFEPVEG